MGKAGKLDLEMKEILRSFEKAEKDTSSLPLNPPPADEFDRIWTRIQAERELIPDSVPTVKPRRRCINKIFAVGVAAAVLTRNLIFIGMGEELVMELCIIMIPMHCRLGMRKRPMQRLRRN